MLLTIKEAATACRMSTGFISAALRAGELPFVRLGKVRGKRIRPEDLKQFIDRKIEVSARSHEQETAALTKMQTSLNQWVEPRDR
jgi:excisionase family DNA binding protein